MIVQCATFFKSLNLQDIVKSVSDIRFRNRFLFESSFWISVFRIRLQTHYPAGYPNGKPDSRDDHRAGVKQNFWLAKFLTSHPVRMHSVILHILNTMIKLII